MGDVIYIARPKRSRPMLTRVLSTNSALGRHSNQNFFIESAFSPRKEARAGLSQASVNDPLAV